MSIKSPEITGPRQPGQGKVCDAIWGEGDQLPALTPTALNKQHLGAMPPTSHVTQKPTSQPLGFKWKMKGFHPPELTSNYSGKRKQEGLPSL